MRLLTKKKICETEYALFKKRQWEVIIKTLCIQWVCILPAGKLITTNQSTVTISKNLNKTSWIYIKYNCESKNVSIRKTLEFEGFLS